MQPFVLFAGLALCLPACTAGSPKDTDGVDHDGDGFAGVEDCDDNNDTIHPDADEVCDGLDNNCDAIIDEDAIDRIDWYTDVDGDGFGDPGAEATTACEAPTGSVDNNTDCDDGEATVYPGATELCDELDNDCNEQTDEGLDYYLTSAHLTMGSISNLPVWSVSYDDDGRLSTFQFDNIWNKELEEFGFLDEDWLFTYDATAIAFSGTTSGYNMGDRGFMEGTLDPTGNPSFIKLDTQRDGTFDPGEDYTYTYEWYDTEQYTYRGLDNDFDGVMDSDVVNTFDPDGRTIHAVATSYTGTSTEWEIVNAYDEHGNLTYASVDIHADGSPELVMIINHTYDETGNRTSSTYDNGDDGVLDGQEAWLYDEQGRMIQYDVDNTGSGVFDEMESWLYDENDNVILYTYATDNNEDGKSDEVLVRIAEYDPASRPLFYEEDNDMDGLANYRETYTYDDSLNTIIKDIDRNGDETVEWQFIFEFDENDSLVSALYSFLDGEQDNLHVTLSYDEVGNRTQEAWDYEAENEASDTQLDYRYACLGEPIPEGFVYEHFYKAAL